MKKIRMSICMVVMMLLFAGCSKNETAHNEAVQTETEQKKTTIQLGLTKAAPALPVLQMVETNAMGDNIELEIDYWDSPEQLIAMTQDKEHDMFALPLTVGAKLYNKGVGIQLTNVDTWGITYFVTSDDAVKEWSDLKGKTIYVPLKSSPPDIVLRYFLNANGIDPEKDVELVYASTSEVAQLVKSGEAEYAVLLEPQVTNCLSGNDQLRIAFSYDEEWQKAMENSSINIPNAGIGATTEFINSNSEVVVQFEEEYKKALNYLLENPKEAGALGEKYFGVNADIMEQAMETLGLMYKEAYESMEDLNSFYQVLYDYDSSTIGGAIPDEGFYYQPK